MGLLNFAQEDGVSRGDANPLFLIHRTEVGVGYEGKIVMFEPSVHSPIREVIYILRGKIVDLSRLPLFACSPNHLPVFRMPS